MSDGHLPGTVEVDDVRAPNSVAPDLVAIGEVVRRVVAARVADRHVVEDLTQEALLRVAGVERKLTPGAMQAYAIVTARHLVFDHARKSSMDRRHQHRLVDYTTLAGPEQVTLEREETDALATALEALDPGDRALLVRHEADGASTAELAGEAGSSNGAIVMRLARARATLRLEFLLAFRRVTLPTARCRLILLALSAGDRRRQDALGAADHLLTCPTCAALARPVMERRRGIAAWLVVPIGGAVRRTVRLLRHSRLAQAATAVVATAVITVGFVLARPHDSAQVAPAPTSTATPTTTAPTTTAPTTTVPVATTSPATTPPCPAAVPLDEVAPGLALGCQFAPTALTVTDVPADEGFWARTAAGHELWVQLVGDGESPVKVRPGEALTVTGTIAGPAGGPEAADPRVQASGFIAEVAFADVHPG